ncbi:MAG: (2Fe-2S) ferredoxin domain-containing protein [Cyanobacteria bacterium P01_G01_bin.39]
MDIDFSQANRVDLDPSQAASKKIVVCRGRSCRKYNAEKVWEHFQQNLPSDVELMSVPCLGQCGNGAMVAVEPEKTWYWQVHPDEVQTVIEQHIIGNSRVEAMLYPKFHK